MLARNNSNYALESKFMALFSKTFDYQLIHFPCQRQVNCRTRLIFSQGFRLVSGNILQETIDLKTNESTYKVEDLSKKEFKVYLFFATNLYFATKDCLGKPIKSLFVLL